MKSLPEGMADHLASGATTLCWCWRLVRRDGVTLGFTDHDHDVTFGGVIYEAQSGFTATEIRESVGLNVDNLEVTGAISSDRLTQEDLAAGVYDDASVDIFRVNWSEPSQHVIMRSGSLGEVTRDGRSFTAEVRGLAHYLQQPTGRVFQYSCDADLGDARCGVDLTSPTQRGSGTIQSVILDRKFFATGLGSYQAEWFARGLLTFVSGDNANRSIEVKSHAVLNGAVTIELWRAPPRPLKEGDAFHLTAGCDKTIATCRAKFANAVNYRGFPHMPGNDLLTRFAGN